MKMESLQQRREELERKEYQLKESLLKFDKFLKVCLFLTSNMSAIGKSLSPHILLNHCTLLLCFVFVGK